MCMAQSALALLAVPEVVSLVLDKQVATIEAASTAAQQLALLAVARAEVADLESLKPVASMEVFLELHTNESAEGLSGLVFLQAVATGEPGIESCIGESGNGT